MVDGVIHLPCQECIHAAIDVDAGEGVTAAAEDGALDGAAVHGDVDIARHTAVGMVGVEEVTAAAEDVAIPSGDTFIADVGSRVDGDRGAAQDVAVGAAAEDGTPNLAAADGDKSTINVGIFFSQPIRIVGEALATAEDVGVQAGVVQRSNLAAADGDRSIA